MTRQARNAGLMILAGLLFILAGLRNMFLPGVMSISAAGHPDGTAELAIGAVFVILGLAQWKRSYGRPPR